MPTVTSLDHLITALRGRSESARRAAVEALVQQGNAAVAPLMDALADPHWEVRRAAVQALVRIGDPQATIAVFRMWAIGSHIIHLQQATVEAWERLKDTVAVEPLCGLLTDTDAAVRQAAVEALGATGSSRALRPLEEARKQERQAAGWRERREKCRPYDEAMARIMDRLKARGADKLPVPASSPDPDTSTLRRIAAPPTPQTDTLPIPSSEPEAAEGQKGVLGN
jgi:HEAT repeat protein